MFSRNNNAFFVFQRSWSFVWNQILLSKMPRLDVEHRTKIIEFWHQTKSVTQVQRLYAAHFNIHKRNAPQPRTIRSTVMKFTREGSVCDRNKGRSGRPRTSRSDPNVAIVRESVVRSPRQSIRRLSSETDIPRSSVQRILRQDIHAYPYKIQSQTELTNEQKQKWVDFANWFSGKLEEDEDFLKKIHMTDECHAHLSGVVNSQNYRYWGTHNPGNAATEQVPRSVLKVTMWVAIGWYGIIGPYFFEDAQGCTCTVNQENYREMIRSSTCLSCESSLAKETWFKWEPNGSSRMGPLPIQQGKQGASSISTFKGASSPSMRTSSGHPTHLISLHQISSCGVISRTGSTVTQGLRISIN